MKKTGYLTFGAVMSALSVTTMLMSYVPTLTYSVPALAGMFVMVVVIEAGVKWAVCSYAAAAVISMLIAEPEAALFFLFLFGCYPIIKVPLERIKFKPLKYLLKLVYFNASVLAVYFAFTAITGTSMLGGEVKQYVMAAILVLANFVFLVYDYALGGVSAWYIVKLHNKVSKLIKR
ncbi:MAG: hypothetical protein IJ426_01855 [Clostridia bacterium]|nr:hypothetical protein [Clostridia bacterium]